MFSEDFLNLFKENMTTLFQHTCTCTKKPMEKESQANDTNQYNKPVLITMETTTSKG